MWIIQAGGLETHAVDGPVLSQFQLSDNDCFCRSTYSPAYR